MKIKSSEEVCEALFELQVSAFIQGLVVEPAPRDFGLEMDRAQQICLVMFGAKQARETEAENVFQKINSWFEY